MKVLIKDQSYLGIFVLMVLLSLQASDAVYQSSTGTSADTSALRDWTTLHLSVIQQTFGFLSPPGVSRSLHIAMSCIWDATAPYTSDHVAIMEINRRIERRPEAEHTIENRRQALSLAAYLAMADIFKDKPTQLAAINGRIAQLGINPSSPDTQNLTHPLGIAKSTCSEILAYRRADGMNQLGVDPGSKAPYTPYADYTGYTARNPPQTETGITNCSALLSINHWQQLRVPTSSGGTVVRSFLAPYMSLVKPFAMSTAAEFRPPGPPLDGTNTQGRFRGVVAEVLALSGNLNDRDKVVAEFWADGPDSTLPPGHWHKIAADAALIKNLNVTKTMEILFLQAAAVFDGGICSWDAKVFFDHVRPITALQCVYQGQTVRAWKGPYQGVGSMDGGRWQPYQNRFFVTPPFAEYTSGHSTFSGASAEVLKSFFGSDVFVGSSHTVAAGASLFEPRIVSGEPGFIAGVTDVANTGYDTVGYVPAAPVTLSWDTWTQAAEEAGFSRLVGGIHFQPGNIDGMIAGRKVGAKVWQKFKTEMILNFTSVTVDSGDTPTAAVTSDSGCSSTDVTTSGVAVGAVVVVGVEILTVLLMLLAWRCTEGKRQNSKKVDEPVAMAPAGGVARGGYARGRGRGGLRPQSSRGRLVSRGAVSRSSSMVNVDTDTIPEEENLLTKPQAGTPQDAFQPKAQPAPANQPSPQQRKVRPVVKGGNTAQPRDVTVEMGTTLDQKDQDKSSESATGSDSDE